MKLYSIVAFVIICLLAGGWVANVYKFAKSDFQEPYKTEVVRGIGIVIAPVGIIAGYMDIGDEVDEP